MRKFKHVVIFGIDGGGHFLREAETPNFDRIFAGGAITYNALTSFPSISAECWASLMTGVSPALHGRNNSILGSEVYPDDSPFPTLYKGSERFTLMQKSVLSAIGRPSSTGLSKMVSR